MDHLEEQPQRSKRYESDKRYNEYIRPEWKTKFYKSAKWRKKREYIMKRDKYACQRCRGYGINKPGKIVHHRKPLEDYPELAFKNDNLVYVCQACHNLLHAAPKSKKFNYKRMNYVQR